MADFSSKVDDLFPELTSETTQQTDKDTAKLFGKDVGVSSLGSFFAGIGSGLFKIPEGFVSIGANLIDLGTDANTAEKVEKFFADINPFDEYAEATTAGKISEILTNLAIPVGVAGKIASTATKGALAAKKSGNYFKLLDSDGLPILEGLKKGQKIKDAGRLAQLNRKGQALQLGATGLASGAAEAVFVSDPDKVGTFGDLFDIGPTKLERGEDYDPSRELYNRLKLGIEGAAFTGILSLAGSGVKKLADSSKAGRVAQDKIGRALDYVSQRLRPRSGKNPQYFTDEMAFKGMLDGDLNKAQNIAFKLDDQIDSVIPFLDRANIFSGKAAASQTAIAKQLNKTLISGLDEKGIVFGKTNAINTKTGEFIPNAESFKRLKDKFIKDGLSEKEAIKRATKEAQPEEVLRVVLPKISADEASKSINLINQEAKKFGKTIPKAEQKAFIDTLEEMRQGWGDLLSIEGRSLDITKPKQIVKGKVKVGPSVFDRWKKLLPETLSERLDSGYKVFKNNPIKLADNVAPAKELIKQEEKNIKNIANNLPTPVKLSNQEAKKIVGDIYQTAFIDRKLPLSNKGNVLFKIPNYFVDKSFVSKAAKYPNKQLKQLTPDTQALAKRLLGKDESAMSTILNGTNMLSTVIRRDEFYRNLLQNSNDIKVARAAKINELMKQGMSAEEASAKAPIQTFFDTEEELIKATGAKVGDYRRVGTVSQRGEEGLEQINPLTDRSKERALLKGEFDPKTGGSIWEETANQTLRKPSVRSLINDYEAGFGKKPGESISAYLKRKGKDEVLVDVASINPLTGKWTLKGNADALYNVNKNIIGPESGFAGRLYANAILYPKATSQMAKTILSPFTHMRNFLSAGAFATANGLIPFIGPGEGAARKALRAIQLGPRSKEGNQIYQELLRRGVVNSQVQLADLKALLKDVDFGSYLGSIKAFDKLAKGLSRVKRFAQDAYTAEDDFWKIFSYYKEQDRLFAAYKKAGIAEGNNFVNMAGKTVKFNRETVADEAAAIVRNNIPNYAYVSDFVKGLRQYPVGNFVSFPAEIMRTGTNIVKRGLDEMFYTVKLPNGNTIKPLRTIGLQRLVGMGVTTSVVPYAAVSAGQALYDISKDELDAIRRYVPKWSKNSTLIPLKGEDGKFKYIDFSHMNAYDTLTRPIQTVINRVQAGEQDKDGIMDDFILGLFESTKELGAPFITESIWTEALADLYMRGGETRDGFRVYNENDSLGNQLYNSLAHLIKAQAPLNYQQLKRIGLSLKPDDDLGRFDKRGKEYEFGNELAGIIGARAVEIDPANSIKYKVADYARGTRNSKALFTRTMLKGGPVTPEEIFDAYINANRALYKVQKTMSNDIKAAQILGLNEDQLYTEVAERIGGPNFGYLSEGLFRPMKISSGSLVGFQEIADQLGIVNPIEYVIDSIEELRASLSEYSLTNENIPDITNPFKNLPKPDLGPVSQLPPVITGADTNVVAQNAKYGSVPFTALPQDQKEAAIDRLFD
jgi:hypothetical protein